jgi:hypothetical protein
MDMTLGYIPSLYNLKQWYWAVIVASDRMLTKHGQCFQSNPQHFAKVTGIDITVFGGWASQSPHHHIHSFIQRSEVLCQAQLCMEIDDLDSFLSITGMISHFNIIIYDFICKLFGWWITTASHTETAQPMNRLHTSIPGQGRLVFQEVHTLR